MPRECPTALKTWANELSRGNVGSHVGLMNFRGKMWATCGGPRLFRSPEMGKLNWVS